MIQLYTYILFHYRLSQGIWALWWLIVKIPPANAGNVGSIPGLGRFSGEGNGNPLQYSCLGNPMYRGAWWATIHGIAKESDMTEQLNNNKRLNIVHCATQ